MAITVAADLAAGQIAMVDKARFTYEHIALCASLFNKMTLGKGEKSKYIPKFGTVTAVDLTDGVDMADAQTISITGTTHTTDEAGCKVIVTKKLRNQLKADAYAAAGVVIGNAMGRKIDKDGLGLFSGLNSGLGSAGTTFAVGYIAAAVNQCIGQAEPVPLPLVCVLHPHTGNDIVTYLATPGTTNIPPDFQMDVLRNYWRGNDKLYGVPILLDGNTPVDSSDDAYGAVFCKLTFVYLVGWEPERWVAYDDSLRGWEIGIVTDYGMVEEDGTYGRYLLFDATAPTS